MQQQQEQAAAAYTAAVHREGSRVGIGHHMQLVLLRMHSTHLS
jgi:hypothetical protein